MVDYKHSSIAKQRPSTLMSMQHQIMMAISHIICDRNRKTLEQSLALVCTIPCNHILVLYHPVKISHIAK